MKDLTHFSSKQFWVKNDWIPEKFRLDYILKDSNIKTMAPLSYLAFLSLWKDASLILTDSGGIQEETTVLGIPCLAIRENTERPITVERTRNECTRWNNW